MQKIQAPSECPECKGALTRINDQLFCENSQCNARVRKSVEHFAKALKIKGLGPATIEKLQLESINDIYELSKDELDYILGEKLGSKLWQEIEASKTANIEDLITAFGIPLIGKTAANKVKPYINNLNDLSEEVILKSGLGPVASSNFIEWLKTDYPKLAGLPFNPIKKTLENTTDVCISGKLLSFKTKEEAAKELEKLGYNVVPNLTKKVKILVNESGKETSKTKNARESGITIVTDLRKFIYESTEVE